MTDTPDTSSLSIHELSVVTEYLKNGFNAAQASHTVKPHISYDTAKVEGSKLINRPHVKEYIQLIKDSMAAKTELNKSTLIDYCSYGLMIAKERDDIGSLFKGVDTTAKLIGAYDQGQDDLSLYSSLISKIQGNNVQINIGCNNNIPIPDVVVNES
jgi:hypothetical protein